MALKAKGEKHGPGQALSSNSVVWKKERLGGILTTLEHIKRSKNFKTILSRDPPTVEKHFYLKPLNGRHFKETGTSQGN